MSGGGSQPTSQTVTQTTIPEYLRPQVESMVGQAAGLMQGQLAAGYQPYEGQRIAGFTPMQAQAFQQVAGQQVAPQITDASNMALGAGQAALGYGSQASGIGQAGMAAAQQAANQAAGQAQGYGQLGSQFGGFGYGIGVGAEQAAAGRAEAASQAAQRFGSQGAQYGAQATEFTPQVRALIQSATGMGTQASMTADEARKVAEAQADIYGRLGSEAGLRGEAIGARGVSAAEQGFGAQQAYQQMATSPEAIQAYMSPYMQAVVAQQQRDAVRQADIQRQANQAAAVGQGAFGGTRSALVEAELQKNLAERLGDIQAAGSQQAFQQAQQAQQYGAGLGIQGLQAGLQGLQAGMQGTGQAVTGAGLGLQGTGQRLAAGQLGLQGAGLGIQGAATGLQGVGQAGQLYGVGISGAQAGLQGVGQQLAAGQLGLAGSQAALTGSGLGIQGAQTGLQGVGQQIAAGQLAQQGVSNALQGQSLGIAGSQAATGAAGQLGSLGGQQFQQQMAITDALQKYGALQQAQQQQGLDVDYQNYLASQNFPYQQLGFFSDIIRGLPMSQSTQTMYGGQPSAAAQIPGMLMAGAGYFGGRGAAEGGRIQKYAGGGSVAQEALTLEDARALPSKLRRLSDTQLAAYARTVKDAVTLSSIQSEVQRRAQARQPYNPNATLQPTMADQVVKRAEAASIGGTGMAGGGIVALQEGGTPEMMMGGYQPTAEELSQYQPGPTMGQAISDKINAAKAARAEEDAALRAQFLQQNAPHVLQASALVDEGAMGAPAQTRPQAETPLPPPPEDKSGIAGAGAARQGAPAAASSGIAGASMFAKGIIPGSFEDYRAQIAQAVQRSPEDQKLLNDMSARVQERIGKAAKQEDRAKYDALMMAGLAMMSGNSLADGLMKAAQAGGATFMSSTREARKAMDAAEEADITFQKYKIALDRNDKKEAGDLFKDYSAQVLKLQEIQSKYADIGARKSEAAAARQAALDQKTEDRLRSSYGVTSANIARTEKELGAEYTKKEQILLDRLQMADAKTKPQIQAQLTKLSEDYTEAKRRRTDPMFENLKDTAKKLGLPAPVSYSDIEGFSLSSVRSSK